MSKLAFPVALTEFKMKHIYLDFKVTLDVCSREEKMYHIINFLLFLQREGDSNTDLKLHKSLTVLMKHASLMALG